MYTCICMYVRMLYTVVTKCRSRANDGALDNDFEFKIGPISPIIGFVNPF